MFRHQNAIDGSGSRSGSALAKGLGSAGQCRPLLRRAQTHTSIRLGLQQRVECIDVEHEEGRISNDFCVLLLILEDEYCLSWRLAERERGSEHCYKNRHFRPSFNSHVQEGGITKNGKVKEVVKGI